VTIELCGKEFSRYTFRFAGDLHNFVSEMGLLCSAKGFKKVYFIGLDILPSHGHLDQFKGYVKGNSLT